MKACKVLNLNGSTHLITHHLNLLPSLLSVQWLSAAHSIYTITNLLFDYDNHLNVYYYLIKTFFCDYYN